MCIPVIASKSSPWSILEDFGCGLTVENNPEAFAQAIIKPLTGHISRENKCFI